MKRVGLALTLVWTGLAAAPAAAQIPDEFTNLKVFPKEIGKRELITAMKQFTEALGVRCDHCHMGTDDPETVDFASDALEPKRVARAMMQLTQRINRELLPTTGRKSLLRVRCVTCHRGLARPEPIDDTLRAAVEDGGVDAALARYDELRDEYHGSGAYDFSPRALNGLAEMLAREKSDSAGAMRVLQRNIALHPDASYSHVMLGHLQLQQGDKPAAIASLKRAVELEPDNEFAKRMLERAQAAE